MLPTTSVRSGSLDSELNMPIPELRARLKRITADYKAPFSISKHMMARLIKRNRGALDEFINGVVPQRDPFGGKVIKKLIKLAIRIETGEWEYIQFKCLGIGRWESPRIVVNPAPKRPLPPVNSVEITPFGVKVKVKSTPQTPSRMPSFAGVLGGSGPRMLPEIIKGR